MISITFLEGMQAKCKNVCEDIISKSFNTSGIARNLGRTKGAGATLHLWSFASVRQQDQHDRSIVSPLAQHRKGFALGLFLHWALLFEVSSATAAAEGVLAFMLCIGSHQI